MALGHVEMAMEGIGGTSGTKGLGAFVFRGRNYLACHTGWCFCLRNFVQTSNHLVRHGQGVGSHLE